LRMVQAGKTRVMLIWGQRQAKISLFGGWGRAPKLGGKIEFGPPDSKGSAVVSMGRSLGKNLLRNGQGDPGCRLYKKKSVLRE